MTRPSKRHLVALLLAVACFFVVNGCAGLGDYIQDVTLQIERQVPVEQNVLHTQLGYYMDIQYRNHTEALKLPDGKAVRIHIGEALDEALRANLGYVYETITVLPSNLFSEKQWAFDYPGVVIPEIDNIAINPADLTTKLSMLFTFYARGRRKVGEARLVSSVSLVTMDTSHFSPEQMESLRSEDQTMRLRLSVSLAIQDIIRQFTVVQPQLLKPVRHKGQILFISPYSLPLDVDFKPSSIKNMANERALKSLERLSDILQANKNLKIRVEVHAFDYLNKVYEYPPKILAPERAKLIKEFLVKREIDPGRIDTLGLEDFYPMADNSIPEGWDRNDRVDFVVLK